MYHIDYEIPFQKSYNRLIKKDPSLEKRIKKSVLLLSENPRHPSLRTHKPDTKKYGKRYSSWVIGDLRIIWDYGQKALTIIALDLGGHSGKDSVYK